jgi:hypothetical protein
VQQQQQQQGLLVSAGPCVLWLPWLLWVSFWLPGSTSQNTAAAAFTHTMTNCHMSRRSAAAAVSGVLHLQLTCTIPLLLSLRFARFSSCAAIEEGPAGVACYCCVFAASAAVGGVECCAEQLC